MSTDELTEICADDIQCRSRFLQNDEIRVFKILDVNLEDEAEGYGADVDLNSQRKGKCVVLKTSTCQIQELNEAILLPLTQKERFGILSIKPLKGVLLCGPPCTGKTLMARACAAQTNAAYLKLACPGIILPWPLGVLGILMFIGDGAKLVKDAFQLAKEKNPCILFTDEVDAIGTQHFDSEVKGDCEVKKIMLELINQLDAVLVGGVIAVEVVLGFRI